MQIFEVVSRYIDNKKDEFRINVVDADVIPENTFVSLKTRDIYHDYFTDRKEAEEFVKNSKKGYIKPDGTVTPESERA